MRVLAAGLAVATVLASARADADPNAADKETARRLMSEGRAHRKQGDLKAALQSFIAADGIMHVPTTGVEVAKVEVDLGQLVEARDVLLSVTRIPEAGNEPRAFAEARATAQTLGAELASRIPSVLVKLTGGAPGVVAKVTMDGVQIPPVALTAPRAVDPGHHVIVATVPGAEPKQAEVDVKEGETKEVGVDLTPPEGSTPVAASKPAETGGTPPLRLASYVSFGVGGAGLIVGAVTGILAITNLSSAKGQGCVGNQCPPSASSDLNTATTMATLSTVGFIVGGVGVGGGVVAFLLSRRSPPPADTSQPAAPTVSFDLAPGGVGVHGTF